MNHSFLVCVSSQSKALFPSLSWWDLGKTPVKDEEFHTCEVVTVEDNLERTG